MSSRDDARSSKAIVQFSDDADNNRGESGPMLLHHRDQGAPASGHWSFDAPRSYLFVSSHEPLMAAAAVWSWAEGPPDLCVTSPSLEARGTASFAVAGRFVTVLVEPMLAPRWPDESWDD